MRQLRSLARMGSVRVRLTVAAAILSSTGLIAGGALLVRGVESTVIRAIEAQSLAELKVMRRQIEDGAPVESVLVRGMDRTVTFVRPDGSRVERPWPDSPGSVRMPFKEPPSGFNAEDQRLAPRSAVQLPLVSSTEGPLNAIAVNRSPQGGARLEVRFPAEPDARRHSLD